MKLIRSASYTTNKEFTQNDKVTAVNNTEKVKIAELPSEILQEIVSHCLFQERQNFKHTCRYFKESCKLSDLEVKKLDFSFYSKILTAKIFQTKVIPALAEYPKLEIISLAGCNQIGYDGLNTLLQKYPEIKSLDCSGLTSLTIKDLRRLLKEHSKHQLKELNLSNCQLIWLAKLSEEIFFNKLNHLFIVLSPYQTTSCRDSQNIISSYIYSLDWIDKEYHQFIVIQYGQRREIWEELWSSREKFIDFYKYTQQEELEKLKKEPHNLDAHYHYIYDRYKLDAHEIPGLESIEDRFSLDGSLG